MFVFLDHRARATSRHAIKIAERVQTVVGHLNPTTRAYVNKLAVDPVQRRNI